MKVLANPNNWFPPVDQVDRPYFIAITGCEQNRDQRIFSEYTNFNVLSPMTGSRNNWFEYVDKGNLQYFIIKGRFGYYWLDFESGLLFCAAQHQEGEHPLVHYVLSLEVQGKLMSDEFVPSENSDFIRPNYKLKHFKVNEHSLMNPIKSPVIGGMNTQNIKPKEVSHVDYCGFGWEIPNDSVGRVTFEGLVYNRRPRLDLHLLYSLPPKAEEQEVEFRMIMWDAQKKVEKFKLHHEVVKKGETMEWQERIL